MGKRKYKQRQEDRVSAIRASVIREKEKVSLIGLPCSNHWSCLTLSVNRLWWMCSSSWQRNDLVEQAFSWSSL